MTPPGATGPELAARQQIDQLPTQVGWLVQRQERSAPCASGPEKPERCGTK
jgi:hypothetical protein